MASFEQTQDEGYSEDPLTVSTGSMARPSTLPPLAWLANVSVADRTRKSEGSHVAVHVINNALQSML